MSMPVSTPTPFLAKRSNPSQPSSTSHSPINQRLSTYSNPSFSLSPLFNNHPKSSIPSTPIHSLICSAVIKS